MTSPLSSKPDQQQKADGAILKDGHAIGVVELKGMNTTDLSKIEQQAFGYKTISLNVAMLLLLISKSCACILIMRSSILSLIYLP